MVRRVLEEGWSLAEAAEAAGVSERTCQKWVARYRSEDDAGLCDRSSEPRSVPQRTPEERVAAIAVLRRLRMTGAEIAEALEMALSTVSAVLGRIGLGKLSRLEPPEPPNRYERARPGELIHVDGQEAGADRARSGTPDDGQAHPPRQGRRLGVRPRLRRRRHAPGLRRGPSRREGDERSRPPEAGARLLSSPRRLGRAGDDRQRPRLRLDRPRDRLPGDGHPPPAHPPLPTAHGKAERFIRTMLGGWAYGAIYRDSAQRSAAPGGWLDLYNWRRPHGSLAKRPPGARLAELNNVAGSYT